MCPQLTYAICRNVLFFDLKLTKKSFIFLVTTIKDLIAKFN